MGRQSAADGFRKIRDLSARLAAGGGDLAAWPIPRRLEAPPIDGVVVRECGEALVEVGSGGSVHAAAAYHARGMSTASEKVKVRERVLGALQRASAALPAGIDIVVWDGLRSLETQIELVELFRATAAEAGRDGKVERYLARPPESEESLHREPPPHATGGAVDVSLCDVSGRPLELGAEFDEFGEAAWLAHFERSGRKGVRGCAPEELRRRRRMLFWCMLGAGFAPWPWEFWHYELGTMLAAGFHGEPYAEYGVAVPWVKPG